MKLNGKYAWYKDLQIVVSYDFFGVGNSAEADATINCLSLCPAERILGVLKQNAIFNL